MVNEYSFGLDAPQDTYLQHDKLGAHYSKNWTKEKQQEYNKWYYENNKSKLNYKKHKMGLAGPFAEMDQKNIHRYRTYADTSRQVRTDALRSGDWDVSNYAAKEARWADKKRKDLQNEIGEKQKDYDKYVRSDKEKLSNKISYDVDTTLNKIKNKLLK